MAAFSGRYLADYNGTTIEVEFQRNLLGLCSAYLVIGNERVDRGQTIWGTVSLRHTVDVDDSTFDILVEFYEGWTGSKATLLIDGRPHPIQQMR